MSVAGSTNETAGDSIFARQRCIPEILGSAICMVTPVPQLSQSMILTEYSVKDEMRVLVDKFAGGT
jgi:hypothetical protein